jgi:prevent-host-death family protein
MRPIRKTVPAARFKAECLALLDWVARTGESLVVTKRGRPVAKVVPLQAANPTTLRSSVTFHRDVVGPILGAWEMDK